ncbi:MAG: hypothetical protein NC548_10740 [Lachnospiraceae bacterium]|nr:hypothetical protein [Lachnospiraceae bacterium]
MDFYTFRTHVRTPVESVIQVLYDECFSDASVMRYSGISDKLYSLSDVRHLYKECNTESSNVLFHVIDSKSSGGPYGFVYITESPFDIKLYKVEIVLSACRQCSGYGTEVLSQLIEQLYRNYDARFIVFSPCICDKAGIAIARKCYMSRTLITRKPVLDKLTGETHERISFTVLPLLPNRM